MTTQTIQVKVNYLPSEKHLRPVTQRIDGNLYHMVNGMAYRVVECGYCADMHVWLHVVERPTLLQSVQYSIAAHYQSTYSAIRNTIKDQPLLCTAIACVIGMIIGVIL